MEQAILLETAFLVDLERETRERATGGRATRFLEERPDVRCYLPFVVAGELAARGRSSGRDDWEARLRPFHVVPWTPDVSWHYGRVHRHLDAQGRLLEPHALWTAATALAHDMVVVTARAARYRRVPDLEVEAYR